MQNTTTELAHTWKNLLSQEKELPYFQNIMAFLKKEQANGKIIYPKPTDVFNALKFTPFEEVKVVIIGQDPYHGPKQAHGLCFSVQKNVAIPPSLRNIYKELHDDLGLPIPKHGNLEKWAQQGVLLLNASLTVQAGKPQSHATIGWEKFTDKAIQLLNEHKKDVIFLLWGAFAQRKGQMIDPTRHFVLKAAHPSPLSAHNGFFGCRHFSKTNELLRKMGKAEIDWQIE